MDKFTIDNMNLYYGKFHALKDVTLHMLKSYIACNLTALNKVVHSVERLEQS